MPEIVLNNLFKHTQLQTVFGINFVALTENQPRLFKLQDLLLEFIRHRREVVTRRSIYELRKARIRAHILEGLAVALSNIDPIIALIKAAESPSIARENLRSEVWPAGVVSEMLERAGAELSIPEDMEAGLGFRIVGIRNFDCPSASNFGFAPASVNGIGAGKDSERIRGHSGSYSGPARYP